MRLCLRQVGSLVECQRWGYRDDRRSIVVIIRVCRSTYKRWRLIVGVRFQVRVNNSVPARDIVDGVGDRCLCDGVRVWCIVGLVLVGMEVVYIVSVMVNGGD